MSEVSDSLGKLLDLELEDMEEVAAFKPSSIDEIDEESITSEDESETVKLSDNGSGEIKFEPIKLIPESREVPTAAVDASSITLGETGMGVLAAFRAAVVFPTSILRIGPFIKHVTESNKQRIFDNLSIGFGFTRLPAPKLQNAADRLRLILERFAQRHAALEIEDGIVLWDGAMTVGKSKFDTPPEMMKKLLDEARHRNNSIVGFSKKTDLVLSNGKKLLNVIEDENGPILADVSEKIVTPFNSTYRVMGRTFAVKLATQGFPFRVDVSAHNGNKPVEILTRIMQSCPLYHGYPEALRQAHIHSKLTKDEVIACQRWVVENYNIPIVGMPDMHRMLLAPYG